ncbi:cytochrome p450 [Colletotrichum musicola]|uniref:Cytochrome p450 n=1 Tax=Colletotrichum musicola TaxID=2175873 RepID=A0A8H6KPG1_9PEZI|nr:cytochrome p450 [Colletotrichum musicola]
MANFPEVDVVPYGPKLLLASILSVFLYALYRYSLPKPIPGIPYNEESRRSLFGDIPKLRREAPHEVFAWMSRQARGTGSPVFQVWLGRLAKPTVVLSDFREGQDIMMRRNKEFDRSDLFAHIVGGEARSFHVTMKTGPEWKARRRLLQDLMTPAFLHDVAAPQIYKSCQLLLELWGRKAEIADGRAFDAEHDVFHAALDALDKINSLSAREVQQMRSASTERVDFPVAPDSPVIKSIIQAAENVAGVGATGVPRLAWLVIGWKPSIRSAREARRKFMDDQIFQAIDRYKAGGKDQTTKSIKSAIDLIVQREDMVAQKQGKHASNWLEIMRDESSGFVIAGHDPTSTNFCWGLKFLADDPAVQQKLVENLRAAFPVAVGEKRLTTDREITRARHAEPAIPIDEHLRSPSSQAAAKERGVRALADEDMNAFVPERWITPDEKGVEEFNSAAGPSSPFGLGLRGCFGPFELLQCPASLSSYESTEALARKPVQRYLRLKRREM